MRKYFITLMLVCVMSFDYGIDDKRGELCVMELNEESNEFYLVNSVRLSWPEDECVGAEKCYSIVWNIEKGALITIGDDNE